MLVMAMMVVPVMVMVVMGMVIVVAMVVMTMIVVVIIMRMECDRDALIKIFLGPRTDEWVQYVGSTAHNGMIQCIDQILGKFFICSLRHRIW